MKTLDKKIMKIPIYVKVVLIIIIFGGFHKTTKSTANY